MWFAGLKDKTVEKSQVKGSRAGLQAPGLSAFDWRFVGIGLIDIGLAEECMKPAGHLKAVGMIVGLRQDNLMKLDKFELYMNLLAMLQG